MIVAGSGSDNPFSTMFLIGKCTRKVFEMLFVQNPGGSARGNAETHNLPDYNERGYHYEIGHAISVCDNNMYNPGSIF